MKNFTTAFRRYFLLTALPAAALAFSGCGKDGDNGPGNGRVMAVHAAASANVRVKVLIENSEIGQLNYGANSSYLNAAAGAREVKINVATSDQNAVTQSVTIQRDQNQSIFAYAPDGTTVALLPVADDLTAPAAGKAKVRLVHLAQGAPSPVNLGQASAAGSSVNVIPGVAFPTASAFVEITPGEYNFVVTNSAGATILQVGNGTGTGTGLKNYTAGKIYTVVVRGINGNFNQELQPRATVIENN